MSSRYEVPRAAAGPAPSVKTPLPKKKRKGAEIPPQPRYARAAQPRTSRPPRTRPRRATSADPRERDAAATSARRAYNRRRRPAALVYVDDPVTCRQAVDKLLSCPRVAVDCEGVQLSRKGRLCLLQMASPDCIYIVDLVGPNPADLSWTRRFFEEGGLKQLLESPDVCKVMHDCRHDSDALYHQFDVKLGPVIDTQVVFSVLRRVRGMQEGLPVSLKTLLKKFAGATEEELTVKNSVKDTMRGDDDFWLKRPLSQQALQYARLDVEYLLNVVQLLAKYIEGADKNGWQTVLTGSQNYLTVFRDDEDGPRKAQQQYEQMARVARRQRVAHDHTKRIQKHQTTDPMRKFVFDTATVLQALAI